MLMLMLCQFVPYTYITPLLHEVTGLDAATVPWVLLLCGIGSTAGALLGGRLSNRLLMPTLMVLPAVQAAMLAVVYVVSPYPVPMVAALFVWSGLNFAIGAPIQTRILTWTSDAPNLASSLIPSGFNVGIAIAASLGATMLNAGVPYRSLPLVGVAAMIVATAVAVGSNVWEKRSGSRPPLPGSAPQEA
jgi:DHA1 family inner membrane transport protein